MILVWLIWLFLLIQSWNTLINFVMFVADGWCGMLFLGQISQHMYYNLQLLDPGIHQALRLEEGVFKYLFFFCQLFAPNFSLSHGLNKITLLNRKSLWDEWRMKNWVYHFSQSTLKHVMSSILDNKEDEEAKNM